jgi:hypothetical protein
MSYLFRTDERFSLSGRWEGLLKESHDESGNSLISHKTGAGAESRSRRQEQERVLGSPAPAVCSCSCRLLLFRLLIRPEPALPEGVADHLDAALEVELLHDVGFVSLDGLNTDAEI